MTVYESSLLGDEDPVERENAFSQILEASVDPAMEMCQRMSEMRREMSNWDRAVFLINCTTYMQVGGPHIMSSTSLMLTHGIFGRICFRPFLSQDLM